MNDVLRPARARRAAGAFIVGEVDEHRAFRETHPGAVYLHRGETYVVDELDLKTHTVRAQRRKVNYYTRARGNKSTEILDIYDSRAVFGTNVHLGRLKVTETVTGYEKRRVAGNTLLTIVPLDLPPIVFETEGLWFEVPLAAVHACEREFYHFMGSIHALEHAAIGILPLLVMTDRNDLGGISTPMHAEVGLPAVFIYDGMPGGVGLSRQAFALAEELFGRTRTAIASCECELGCPSCVHSPKCGSGNRPIDKNGALFVLDQLMTGQQPERNTEMELVVLQKKQRAAALEAGHQGMTPIDKHVDPLSERAAEREVSNAATPAAASETAPEAAPTPVRPVDPVEPDAPDAPDAPHYGVLDIETQRSAQEVGGWNRADKMGVSCAVLYDSHTGEFHTYLEDQLDALFSHLTRLDLVIGFNIRRFDYKVLSAYTRYNLQELPTLDLLLHVYERLGYRLSLDHLAQATLGAQKSADGLQALAWWKEGRIDEIVAYCKQDVAVTRDLYLYGKTHHHLLFTNKAGQTVRLPVSW
ncbi:MAG: DUF1998 domain-containing protein [Desulfovibrionaceae bacterium]|nr:DUF1998 domain-containing protein [Desulfovibrionaceae bacterium]